MKHLIPKTMAVVPVMALALAVGGCGSSSDDDDMMPVEPTPAEMRAACESDGGRWEADMTCTSAADVAEEMRAARESAQRMAIDTAISRAQTAVNAVDDDSSDAEVSAADAAVAAARTAISNAADVPMNEKDANTDTVDTLAMQLDSAKMDRMEAYAAMKAEEEAMMAATAAKLYAGISLPIGDVASPAATDRAAVYNAAFDAIMVSNGDGTNTPTPVSLSEDEDAMVADNHGWEGKRYTRTTPASDGMYEAVVYSNVGDPTEGKKFNVGYSLADGRVTIDTSGGVAYDGGTANAADTQGRIDLTGVTRTAGTEVFELPDPNPTNEQYILVPGSFHGVSGTYRCDTGASRDAACSASVAASSGGGFTLAGTWTFMPTDANTKVMDAPDTVYASYGWWIHKAANDGGFTASVFVDRRGADPTAVSIADLRGTATYMGGAAGKYALASSTGGMNDAGHFTAMATLKATFAVDHKISGTIDNFIGADGQSRDWSVKLMDSVISDAGAIAGDPNDATDTAAQMTEWTIGGTAAADAGQWSGTLEETGDDGIPGVATGTFYSTYGTAGKMIGAFGATE